MTDLRRKTAGITLDIEKGDILLGGRFKNSPMEVKEIGTDEKGQPTVNGRKLLSFRIKKLMKEALAKEAAGVGTFGENFYDPRDQGTTFSLDGGVQGRQTPGAVLRGQRLPGGGRFWDGMSVFRRNTGVDLTRQINPGTGVAHTTHPMYSERNPVLNQMSEPMRNFRGEQVKQPDDYYAARRRLLATRAKGDQDQSPNYMRSAGNPVAGIRRGSTNYNTAMAQAFQHQGRVYDRATGQVRNAKDLTVGDIAARTDGNLTNSGSAEVDDKLQQNARRRYIASMRNAGVISDDQILKAMGRKPGTGIKDRHGHEVKRSGPLAINHVDDATFNKLEQLIGETPANTRVDPGQATGRMSISGPGVRPAAAGQRTQPASPQLQQRDPKQIAEQYSRAQLSYSQGKTGSFRDDTFRLLTAARQEAGKFINGN